MNEIYKILSVAGVVLSCFMATFLVVRKTNRKANRFFAVIMLFSAVDLLEVYLSMNGLYEGMFIYPISIVPYSYIFGALIFCYSVFVMSPKGIPVKTVVAIFSPSVMAFIINILIFFSDQNFRVGYDTKICINTINIIIGSLYESVLYIISFYKIQTLVIRLREFFSDIARMQLLWLRTVISIMFIIQLTVVVQYFNNGNSKYEIGISEVVLMFFGIVFIFTIAFLAVTQPDIISSVNIMNTNLPDNCADGPRYEKLRMSPEIERKYTVEIVRLMQDEKLYLREDLTLKDIADILAIGTPQLSMILNIHLHMNFYNFINKFRIEETMRLLSDKENSDANILSIAYRSGFNSKSAFNSMFKKFTGMTPTQYRSSLNAGS